MIIIGSDLIAYEPVFLSKFEPKNLNPKCNFIVVSNIFSELSSIIILTLCLPKKNIKINDFIPNKKNIKTI